jgi:hypothetical protein
MPPRPVVRDFKGTLKTDKRSFPVLDIIKNNLFKERVLEFNLTERNNSFITISYSS